MTTASPFHAEVTAGRKSTRHRGYISNYRPQRATVALLNDVDAVLREYRAYLPVSVRQVYYRLVGAYGYEKTEAFYDRLCHHLVQARRARCIAFDAIRDDGVVVMEEQHFEDEGAFRRHLNRLAREYTRDKMARQPVHIEVWCEAAGMLPQLGAVANRYSIPVYSCSGFDSLSAKRSIVAWVVQAGKSAVVLHLGDYDPSGASIFQAAAEDVAAFVVAERYDARATVHFERVALTEGQVAHYRLPTAPPKASDSRSKTWMGETCQLEALPPDVLAEILENAILHELDLGQLDEDREQEKNERRQIAYLLGGPGGAT